MDKRYSEMTEGELHQEIASLTEKARKAEQLGIVNEYAVLERKIMMARAYLLDPDDFNPGEVYEINGDPGALFKISYMNGRFAWGFHSGSREEKAFPISMLRRKRENEFPPQC